MLHVIAIVSLLLYGLSTVLFLLSLSKKRPSFERFGLHVFRLGFVLHSLTLIMLFARPGGSFLLTKNGADFYFLVSWLIAGFYCYFSSKISFPIIGALTSPVIGLFMVSSSYLVHRQSGAPQSQGTEELLLGMHIVPALLAIVALTFAFVLSLVFLIQERRLKKKQLQLSEVNSPSLDFLDRMNRRSATVGFLAMSLAIVSGALWALNEDKPIFSLDLMQWATFISWFLLAFVLYSRASLKWPSRIISRFTVISVGFFYAVVLWLVVFLGSGLHGTIS